MIVWICARCMSRVPPRMLPSRLQFFTAVLALAAASGCQPLIGDDCVADVECSRLGDRICDTTQPGGYCTQFNCGPRTCPDEAICVAFGNTPSTAVGCGDVGKSSPYVRNFCMRMCDTDNDCRPGYECRDFAGPNPWGADIIEGDPVRTTICVLPRRSSSIDPDVLAGLDENVCRGPFPDPANGDPANGAGGAGGAAGASGL